MSERRYERYTSTRTEETPNAISQNCKEILEEINQIHLILLLDELIKINLVNKLISAIQEIFERFSRVTRTFEGYLETINCEIYIHRLADSLINKKSIVLKTNSNNERGLDNESLKIKNVSTELIDHLRCLEVFAHDAAYSKRKEFISFLSISSNKIELLFENSINTEKEINRRARVLSSCFHPDRTTNPKSPYVLREIHKSQGDELFNLIFGFRECLLNKLKKILELEGYEKYGNKLWQITIDYYNASKGHWNKLKVLKKDDIKKLSSELLKRECIIMGELTYNQYRAACKLADKAKLLKRQVKLRGCMALCLYLSNKFLEASLYAFAAIFLQLIVTPYELDNFTQHELDEAKKIFDKVNGGRKEKKKKGEDVSSDSNTDIKLANDPNHAMALIKTNNSFNNNEIIQISNYVNNLVNIITNLFVKAERSLICYQTSYEIILHAKKRANLYIYKRGAIMLEAIIREKLNEIMNKAISAYDDEKYQEFINVLSEEYDKDKRLLIEYSDKFVWINTDDIVNTLKSHGFRSDGIAYLLVVLGEVLGSGKIKIEGFTHAALKACARRFFELALSYELVEEAKELDKCTSKLRQTSQGSFDSGKLKNSMPLKESPIMALVYLQDSIEMPFFSRLEEIRNIARINFAILNIFEFCMDADEVAKKMVKEVQKSVRENYQYVSKAKLRLEVLEDFLRIISGEDLSDPSFFITFPVATTQPVYFEHLAEKEAKISMLNSLRHWQSAQKNYNIVRELDPDNPIYSLGYAKCLLKLSKYTQVIKLSDTCSALNSLSEYWYFRSVAYFKQNKYIDAMSCNSEALNLDPGNNSAGKHRELIKKLNVNNIIEQHNDRYKRVLIYEIDYLKHAHNNERPIYHILSIDGGGIRGVLPALWLSEIEYRTRRPISHLFNMIAGTSTGGVIAAGLSAPHFKPIYKTNDHIEYEYSNLIPLFSASELLNLYKNESKNLFTTSASLFNIPILSKIYNKYTDEGRYTMFEKFFGKTRLRHSLTELVIPTANEDYSHLFTRYDAKNIETNDTFVDILMAATTAPTFFPPYKIGNKTFIDGGIHLNNPASTAYNEAIRYNVPEKNISVLSLGTGCYLPDSSDPDQYNLLFWAQNLPRLMISTQESDTDREPIKLDDHESIPYLLELGYQYIEELDCSDDNPINKL
ncbi:14856_t:CDS:2, partial [Racocetra persica]